MLTFTGSRNLYGYLTDNAETANLTFGDIMINEGVKTMLSKLPWPFLEKIATDETVGAQQTYMLPGDCARLIAVAVTVGNYTYLASEVTSADDWFQVNNPTNVQSDPLVNYYLVGKTVQFWPIPATDGNTITYHYIQQVRDMNTADYTTGTILTATQGSAVITGTATSWTAGMAGSYLRITSSNSANKGDGIWYQIQSVDSATQITLEAPYVGTSISAGAAAYTIGNCSLVPEKFQTGPVYYAAAEYWRKQGNDSRADRFEQKYSEILDLMIEEEGTKSTSVVVSDGTPRAFINPNLARWAT